MEENQKKRLLKSMNNGLHKILFFSIFVFLFGLFVRGEGLILFSIVSFLALALYIFCITKNTKLIKQEKYVIEEFHIFSKRMESVGHGRSSRRKYYVKDPNDVEIEVGRGIYNQVNWSSVIYLVKLDNGSIYQYTEYEWKKIVED